MTISTSSPRTYQFAELYVAGNLSISGPVTFYHHKAVRRWDPHNRQTRRVERRP